VFLKLSDDKSRWPSARLHVIAWAVQARAAIGYRQPCVIMYECLVTVQRQTACMRVWACSVTNCQLDRRRKIMYTGTPTTPVQVRVSKPTCYSVIIGLVVMLSKSKLRSRENVTGIFSLTLQLDQSLLMHVDVRHSHAHVE